MTTSDLSLNAAQEPKPMSFEAQRATLHDRLRRRFEVWLEEILDPEAVPQGLAADILEQIEAETPAGAKGPTGNGDFQAVCEALVGLTETTRDQGAALKQLHQDLPAMQSLTEAVSALLESLAEDRNKQTQERQQQVDTLRSEARQQVFQDLLGPVIDMRDHLYVGLTEAQAAPASRKRWWQTASKTPPSLETAPGQASLDALIKANQLAIEGIDHTLTRWHVELIEGVGQPLNQETMIVVDQMPHPELAAGTVLKVLRAGYRWQGTLCRPAEVCVVQSTETK